MTYANPTPPPAGYRNGAANNSTSLSGFIERFFGSDQAVAIKEDLKGRAVEARDNLNLARTNAVATAKAHPLLTAALVVGGIAAIGLLANPATRRAAIAGGTGLWGKYGHLLTDKMPKS
ncbi:hypothetical protein GVN21_15585 [Caulobacter sp. SLTY]|uniref:hypothetical protein n=1 Tax=Caulobacter sp. SLTY TaxID=2683262 RepID=UPI001412A62C|nr:hypothetical protein [Caulobacter sp. SLTY]NBB16786.1 hypothetical protein [Caulobacter sp. SLTY]